MQLALLSAVTYWIANRVASRLQALMGKVCCYVSAWRCGHLRAACNGLRMWCFRLCCRLCFARATPSRHAHLATSRHLPPPNYYQRRRRARTAPQASPARTPAIARAKILKSSPLLGSFLGRIFTSWRPGFSHFHKAAFLAHPNLPRCIPLVTLGPTVDMPCPSAVLRHPQGLVLPKCPGTRMNRSQR